MHASYVSHKAREYDSEVPNGLAWKMFTARVKSTFEARILALFLRRGIIVTQIVRKYIAENARDAIGSRCLGIYCRLRLH